MYKNAKSKKTVEHWLDHGHGQCGRDGFTPFFTWRFSSKGRTRGFLSFITNGILVTLSDLEFVHVVLAEAARGTVDICPQFALLPWEEPQYIALKLGIRYPKYLGGQVPIVMTSDIVVLNGVSGPYVISVKYFKDVNLDIADEKRKRKILRTLQLLTIEREYWRVRGVPWYLCTERTAPMNRFRSLNLFRRSMLNCSRDYLNEMVPDFTAFVVNTWLDHEFYRLNDFLECGANRFSVSLDESFDLFGRALWTRLLPIDIDTEALHHQRPLRLVRSSADGGTRVAS